MQKNEITETMRNEDFVNSILDMQTAEEVKEAFKEKGVDISLEEIKTIESIINKMVEKNSTELSDEDLSEISGGVKFENLSDEIQFDLENTVLDRNHKKVSWFK